MSDADLNSWYPFPEAAALSHGQLAFLGVVYGYALFQAAGLLGDGAEMLLLVPQCAPVVGSVVIPILGAVPDGMMVLFSGMGENAQDEVSVGVGALAGSTVMLLTVPWFISVFSGRVNIRDGQPTYKRPKDEDARTWDKLLPPGKLDLFGTGVGFGPEIKQNAKMMLATLCGYAVIQVPAIFVDKLPVPTNETAAQMNQDHKVEAKFENSWAGFGMVMCIIEFGFYLYREWLNSQSSEGGIDDNIAAANVQAIKAGRLTLRGAMANFKGKDWASIQKRGDLDEILLKDKDSLDDVRRMCKVLAPFFAEYDLNGDNSIDFEEFRMIFKDVGENLSKEAQMTMFQAADTDKSGNINFPEFVACLMSFALDPSSEIASEDPKTRRRAPINKYLQADVENQNNSDDDEDDDEEAEEEDMPDDLADLDPEEQQRRIKCRAFSKMGWGTFLVLVFSDPMVELLTEMGVRLQINSFYVSFVLAPLASNASELVAAYTLAKKRTVKSMTSSLLSLLGAAIMNNTFVLGIFLALIFLRDLAWTFTAETCSILAIEMAIGVSVYFKTTQTIFDGVIILCYYPVALGIVYFLENIVGFD